MAKDNFQQSNYNQDLNNVGRSIPLPENNDPPFSEPEESSKDYNIDAHQATDTDADKHEKYGAGKETASYQMHRDDVEEGVDDRLKNSDVVERY